MTSYFGKKSNVKLRCIHLLNSSQIYINSIQVQRIKFNMREKMTAIFDIVEKTVKKKNPNYTFSISHYALKMLSS